MENSASKFRASLWGFSRKDVLDYITRTDAAHRERVTALQEELERTAAQRDELQVALQRVTGEKSGVAAAEARVRTSLEESTRTLARTRGELQLTEGELMDARAELERLRAQVQQQEDAARSYEELKERVASIELEAHRRAQVIEDEAKARAEALRQETRDWLRGLLEEYDQVRQSVEGLDRHLRSLGSLSDGLREGDAAAARLREEAEK